MMARWIRLGEREAAEFHALYARLAGAQARRAPPVLAWGLAPAVATYRQFGLPAYLEGEGIWLHGQRIAEARVQAIGECAVIASSFLARFPAKCTATPSSAFELAFRLRLEAQHGWQFEHSWPTAPERLEHALA